MRESVGHPYVGLNGRKEYYGFGTCKYHEWEDWSDISQYESDPRLIKKLYKLKEQALWY